MIGKFIRLIGLLATVICAGMFFYGLTEILNGRQSTAGAGYFVIGLIGCLGGMLLFAVGRVVGDLFSKR